MKDKGHVSHVVSPISGVVLTLIGFLFVDNTNLIIMGTKDDSEMTVHTRLQSAIHYWNKILRVSGGALKLEKCYWYFARFRWENGLWSPATDTLPPILLNTDDNTRTPINYKLPHEATLAVGVWQDMVGGSET